MSSTYLPMPGKDGEGHTCSGGISGRWCPSVTMATTCTELLCQAAQRQPAHTSVLQERNNKSAVLYITPGLY